MSLLVIYTSDGDQLAKEFHVGEDLTSQQQFNLALHTLCVQADGHELELIEDQFDIPMPKTGRVIRWFGSTAKLIIGNIKLRGY